MPVLRRGLAKLQRLAHRSTRTRAELARMQRAAHPSLGSIARAIQRTLDQRLEAGEANWTEEIEALRTELGASTAPVDPAAAAGSGGGSGSIGELCRTSSKTRPWALLLFHIIREHRPERCIELGACLGITAAYQAAAIALNQRGALVTLEGSGARAALADRNLRRLGLDRVRVVTGRFQATLAPVLEESGGVDYAFIDGHHDEAATLAYFDQIAAKAAPGAIVVLDDIDWSPGMRRAWETLRARDVVAASVDLFLMGVCVLGEGGEAPGRFDASIG